MDKNLKWNNIKIERKCEFEIKQNPQMISKTRSFKKSSKKIIVENNKKLNSQFQELDNKSIEIDNYKLILEGMKKSFNELQERYIKEINTKNINFTIQKEIEFGIKNVIDKEKMQLKNDNKLLNEKIIENNKEKQILENEINNLKETIHNMENQIKNYRIFSEKSENQFKETLNLKEKKIIELSFENSKVKELEKQIEHLNELKTENEYLTFINQNSFNYLNIIIELNEHFQIYSNIFKNDFFIKNIYSLCFYDFIFRIKNDNISNLSKNIMNDNIFNRDNNKKNINYSNSKILNYENNLINQIENLILNCNIFKDQYTYFNSIKNSNISDLYSLQKDKLKINLKSILDTRLPYLISFIRYNIKNINNIEFFGDVIYDKEGKCNYIFDLIYNLIFQFESQIKKLEFKNISKIKNSFINCINIMIENFNECKEIYIINSNLDDEMLKNINFKTNNFIYDVIDLSNNKISKPSFIFKLKVKQLNLSKNKFKLKDKLSTNINQLDISDNPISIRDINSFLINNSFSKINLSYIKIKDINECKILSNFINSLNKLEILLLNNCKISLDILIELLNNLNLNKIQEIYLSNNQFSDAGMKVICDFINKNESIKKIEIRNCQITIKGLRELKNIKKKSSIKEIDLLGNILEIGKALDIINNIEGIAFNL